MVPFPSMSQRQTSIMLLIRMGMRDRHQRMLLMNEPKLYIYQKELKKSCHIFFSPLIDFLSYFFLCIPTSPTPWLLSRATHSHI
mmetsp:Transcript_32800/g.53204  ORF Transcript_32800/g.53204 Transcript_32800/m.53204 type:complete len:84 (+) Transcript_32800:721-972(+)